MNYKFITFHDAADFKSRSKKHAVRSHIVKQIIEHRKGNFRHKTFRILGNQECEKSPTSLPCPDPISATIAARLDPFDCLPVDDSVLQLLLRRPTAQQAVEPIFSISDPYSFQDLHVTYQCAFTDPAFANALMCAITMGHDDGALTSEALHYKGQAIDHIHRQTKVESLSKSSNQCTIGAILLLIGVEWRYMSSESARIHLKGLRGFLQLYESEHHMISANVRRGIFWQDVNTAIVSGTSRVLDETMFPEFQWEPAAYLAEWLQLPSGFDDLQEELELSTKQLLRDICVLQKCTEALQFRKPSLAMIQEIDKMQGSIEMRLADTLGIPTKNQLRDAILLTAYLFTYSLFTQIWNNSSIPLRVSERLLEQLQILMRSIASGTCQIVILWCVMIAGCLTPGGTTRDGYGRLLQSLHTRTLCTTSLHTTWLVVSGALDRFLWSQHTFGDRAVSFLEDFLVFDEQTESLDDDEDCDAIDLRQQPES